MSGQVVGILLAAGQSLRFGSNKLLHPFADNKPMLLVSAEKLARVLPDSVVVINPDQVSMTEQLQQLGLRVVVNDNAEEGMGSSIACGVGASQDAAGWLIALADMPYINLETITSLAQQLQDHHGIVRPVYAQQPGHPVGFAGRFKAELMALSGDTGARQVIDRHQSELKMLSTEDAGVITDIDHAADLK
jgi:molybdenum cofactor cytidylyltransferase